MFTLCGRVWRGFCVLGGSSTVSSTGRSTLFLGPSFFEKSLEPSGGLGLHDAISAGGLSTCWMAPVPVTHFVPGREAAARRPEVGTVRL